MRVVVALEHSTCRQHSCTNLPAAGWSQACHRTAHAGTVTPQDSGVVKLMRCDPRLGSTRQARHCRCDGAGHWSRSADRTQRLGPRQHEPSANALLPDTERARASHVLTSAHRASRPRRQARHTMCTAWRPRGPASAGLYFTSSHLHTARLHASRIYAITTPVQSSQTPAR